MHSWLVCTFYHAHITKVLTSNTKSIWQFLLPFQTFRVNTEDTEKHKTTNTHKLWQSSVIASIVFGCVGEILQLVHEKLSLVFSETVHDRRHAPIEIARTHLVCVSW